MCSGTGVNHYIRGYFYWQRHLGLWPKDLCYNYKDTQVRLPQGREETVFNDQIQNCWKHTRHGNVNKRKSNGEKGSLIEKKKEQRLSLTGWRGEQPGEVKSKRKKKRTPQSHSNNVKCTKTNLERGSQHSRNHHHCRPSAVEQNGTH